MALAYTVTDLKDDLPVNSPISLGSVKGKIVEINVTSYASPVVIDPDDVGLSKVLAIIPMGVSDAADPSLISANDTVAANEFDMFVLSTGAEVAADADAGAFKALVLGTA